MKTFFINFEAGTKVIVFLSRVQTITFSKGAVDNVISIQFADNPKETGYIVSDEEYTRIINLFLSLPL